VNRLNFEQPAGYPAPQARLPTLTYINGVPLMGSGSPENTEINTGILPTSTIPSGVGGSSIQGALQIANQNQVEDGDGTVHAVTGDVLGKCHTHSTLTSQTVYNANGTVDSSRTALVAGGSMKIGSLIFNYGYVKLSSAVSGGGRYVKINLNAAPFQRYTGDLFSVTGTAIDADVISGFTVTRMAATTWTELRLGMEGSGSYVG